MAFKLFGDKGVSEKEYFEVNVMDTEHRGGKLGIKVDRINDFADVDRIIKAVRMGHVVFVKIKGLREKDIGELKRSVEKIKKTIMANNGEIIGVEQDWIILSPEYAALER